MLLEQDREKSEDAVLPNSRQRGIIILITQVSKFLTYITAKAMQYATEPKETHFPKDIFEWDAANFQ